MSSTAPDNSILRSALTRSGLLRLTPVVLAFVLVAAAPAPAAAAERSPVAVVRPVEGQLAKSRSVPVMIKVIRPVRSVRVFTGRRDVRLRSAGPGRYRGVVRGLRGGRNVVRVETVTRGGRRGARFVSVIHARRKRGLLGLRAPRRGNSPIRVGAVVPRDEVSFRAWLNGRRIDGRFAPAIRGVRQGSLSASDHLKFGRNRLRVRVVASNRLGTRARYDVATRTFVVPRRRPLVGAGLDRQVTTNTRVRLDGSDSRPHAHGRRLRYEWRLLRRPRGSKARLRSRSGTHPRFVPDKRGRYRIGLVTRLDREAGAAQLAPTSQRDVVTIAADEVYPLFRLRASVPDANSKCYGITIATEQVGVQPEFHTNPSCGSGSPGIHVLTLDRATLEPRDEKSLATGAALLDYVTGLEQQYSGAALPLVVINLDPAFIAASGSTIFVGPSFNQAIRKIGGWGYPSGPLATSGQGGALIVGVPGWQPGDGFQSANPGLPAPDSLTGFFSKDNQKIYRFLPKSGQVQYKTAFGGQDGGWGTMEIAGREYSTTPATDPGFNRNLVPWIASDPYVHVVVVRADAPTLGPPSADGVVVDRAFAVNTFGCNANGCTYDEELKRLAATLKQFVGDRSALVFVQTVLGVFVPGGGKPGVTPDAWYQVGDLLGQLGGSPWVWDGMPDNPRAGGNRNAYALVGGQAIVDEARTEPVELGGQIPDQWTGGPGATFAQGLLALNNFGWFTTEYPLPNDPGQPPNADFGQTLSEILYQEPQPWEDMDTPGKRAAYQWIVSQADKLNFGGDLRAAYYAGTENDDWSGTQKGLGELSFDEDEAAGKFNAADLATVKDQLSHELDLVTNVNKWFIDMRTPLVDGDAQAAAAVGLIARHAVDAVQAPDDTGAKWFFWATDMALGALGVDEALEPAVVAAEVVVGAAELATDTKSDEPITGEIEDVASNLEYTITGNVQVSLDAMNRMRQIILSDWGKLNTVGTLTKKGTGPWRGTADDYDTSLDSIEVGVVRQVYKGLLPAIGKVFQVWPGMAWPLNYRHIDDIRNFRCRHDFVIPGSGKPFDYRVTAPPQPPHHSQPASAQVRLGLWPDDYPNPDVFPQRPPAWSFLAYRLPDRNFFSKWYEGVAPPDSLMSPLSKPPAPNGLYPANPTLPKPGFYMPWFFGRVFQPIQFDCSQYSPEG